MTQHVTINLVDGKFIVNPATASVWRDDQTIMWHLGEGVCWPSEVFNPIAFLEQNKDGYSAWPGSSPTALGNEPEGDEVDRRFYVALARKFMPDGQQERYQYTLDVARVELPDQPIRVRVARPDGTLVDPEVENQSLP